MYRTVLFNCRPSFLNDGRLRRLVALPFLTQMAGDFIRYGLEPGFHPSSRRPVDRPVGAPFISRPLQNLLDAPVVRILPIILFDERLKLSADRAALLEIELAFLRKLLEVQPTGREGAIRRRIEALHQRAVPGRLNTPERLDATAQSLDPFDLRVRIQRMVGERFHLFAQGFAFAAQRECLPIGEFTQLARTRCELRARPLLGRLRKASNPTVRLALQA